MRLPAAVPFLLGAETPAWRTVLVDAGTRTVLVTGQRVLTVKIVGRTLGVR